MVERAVEERAVEERAVEARAVEERAVEARAVEARAVEVRGLKGGGGGEVGSREPREGGVLTAFATAAARAAASRFACSSA